MDTALAKRGSRLITVDGTSNRPHPSNRFGTHRSPVLPAQVADGIRAAPAGGWTPGNPGSPFCLDPSAGSVSSH
ncbi:hypothetical protein GCM10010343_32830 [Streptomyces avidinii]|uniref:Uncharacterized protein n=1 Tax=Streptomyces avidinii TaxID=1895 RepID=A0ABS4LGK6_STRAV|nr:hypothetical protein [Streptomyces avidinii]GGZ04342.1 hypothetical protein GCM10010343_32830 [Streptomyces avidinii]